MYPYPPPKYRRRSAEPLPPDPVVCQLCGTKLWRITANHLRVHEPTWTLRDYKQMFPEAPTTSPTLRLYHQDLWLDQHGKLTLDWTPERALAFFQAETKRRKERQPSARDWLRSKRNVPDVAWIQRTWGSWNAFVEAAGGTPRGVGGNGRKRRKRCEHGHLIIERGGYRFCPVCATDRERRWAKAHDRPGTGEWRTCPICGAGYYVRRYLVEQGNGKTCSRACHQRYASRKRWAKQD